MKVPKRLLDVLEQGVGLTIGGKYLQQSLLTKQLIIGITGVDHPVGHQEHPVTHGHREHFGPIIEGLRAQYTQR
ncbi:hypothetical protein D3C84_1034030 [compost metagenome]